MKYSNIKLQFNNPIWFVLCLALFLISAAHVQWLASGRFAFGAALMVGAFALDAAMKVVKRHR